MQDIYKDKNSASTVNSFGSIRNIKTIKTLHPLFGNKKSMIKLENKVKHDIEINYEVVFFCVRIIKYTLLKLNKEISVSSTDLELILENDIEDEHEQNTKQQESFLQNFIDEK